MATLINERNKGTSPHVNKRAAKLKEGVSAGLSVADIQAKYFLKMANQQISSKMSGLRKFGELTTKASDIQADRQYGMQFISCF